MIEELDTQNTKQHLATKRWLSKPGVRAAQNEKARLCAARNRAKKKELLKEHGSSCSLPEPSPSSHSAIEPSNEASNESPSSLECTEEPFDFRALCIAVADWQIDWGPENLWDKCFYDQLCSARKGGREGVDRFFRKCEKHARKGRAILQRLKSITPRASRCTTDDIRDLFLQGYELVVAVTSEVKFFEVKVDEFAPAVPMSKLSDIRYY